MWTLATALSVASIAVIVGCDGRPSNSWVNAVKECTTTDLTAIDQAKILYLGLANSVPPGSVYRDALGPDGKHESYRLRWVTTDWPVPQNFVQGPGGGYKCKGGKSVSFDIGASVAAEVVGIPVSGEIANDFKKAKTVKVSAAGMGWDEVKEGNYDLYFKDVLKPGHLVYEDLRLPNRLVLYRALAVQDMSIDYEFSAEDAASLKAKYSGPLGNLGTGAVSGNVKGAWKTSTTYSIEAPGKSWMLGELGKYDPASGFATAAVSKFVSEEIKAGPIVNERRKP